MGEEHYQIARRVQEMLQKYNELQDIIAILGMEELATRTARPSCAPVSIQRFLSQPMFVAEKFTGIPGVYVPLRRPYAGFRAIVSGEMDDYPEAAFFNVGTIDDVVEKAKKLGTNASRQGEEPWKPFWSHTLAADRTFYDGACESLVLPTVDGKYGILADHSNIIAAVVPGELQLPHAGRTHAVRPPSPRAWSRWRTTTSWSWWTPPSAPEEIDANRARRAADRAREEMIQKRSIQEYRMAQANLARALNRLRVKGGQ